MYEKWTEGRCLECGKRVWATSSPKVDADYAYWCSNRMCKRNDPEHVGDQDEVPWVNFVAENTVKETLDPQEDPPILFDAPEAEEKVEQKADEIKTTQPVDSTDWLGIGDKKKIPRRAYMIGPERFGVVIPECCATCENRKIDVFEKDGKPFREDVYCSTHGYLFEATWDEVFHRCDDYKVGLGPIAYVESNYLGIDSFERARQQEEPVRTVGDGERAWDVNIIYFHGSEQGVMEDANARKGGAPKGWVYTAIGKDWLPLDMRIVPKSNFHADSKTGVVLWGGEHVELCVGGAVGWTRMGRREGVIPTMPERPHFEQRTKELLELAKEKGVCYIFEIVEVRRDSQIEVYARGATKDALSYECYAAQPWDVIGVDLK